MHATMHQMIKKIDDARAIGKTEHHTHGFGLNRPRAMRDRLIEQRERIAHRAFRRARNEAQCAFLRCRWLTVLALTMAFGS